MCSRFLLFYSLQQLSPKDSGTSTYSSTQHEKVHHILHTIFKFLPQHINNSLQMQGSMTLHKAHIEMLKNTRYHMRRFFSSVSCSVIEQVCKLTMLQCPHLQSMSDSVYHLLSFQRLIKSDGSAGWQDSMHLAWIKSCVSKDKALENVHEEIDDHTSLYFTRDTTLVMSQVVF